MTQPLVSIIIPCYNAAHFLRECIQSAVEQTIKLKEIIVVDDGSTDESLKIAQQFEKDGVLILQQFNSGASAARNLGLKNAKGKYIQFLDSDDLLDPDKIRLQVELLDGQEDLLSLSPTVHFENGDNPSKIPVVHEWYETGSTDPVDFLIKLYGGNIIGANYGGAIQPNAWLTPRKIIDQAGLWNEKLTLDDDGEFFCRIVLAAKGIVYSGLSVNYYRKFKDGNNLSNKQSYKHQRSALDSNIAKMKYLTQKSNNPQIQVALARCFWENAFNFYSSSKDLSEEAERLAKACAPNLKINFYQNKIKLTLSNIFGWKIIKRIDDIRYAKK